MAWSACDTGCSREIGGCRRTRDYIGPNGKLTLKGSQGHIGRKQQTDRVCCVCYELLRSGRDDWSYWNNWHFGFNWNWRGCCWYASLSDCVEIGTSYAAFISYTVESSRAGHAYVGRAEIGGC